MTKDTNYHPNHGRSKKFLYTGPKSKEPAEEDQWNFTPRRITPPGPTIDLDNVWSIKRNVAVSAAQRDRLTLNASKSFYSRHGGMKDENQDGAGGVTGQGNDSEKNWTSSNRNRSYSFGVAESSVSKPSNTLGQRNATDMHDF